MENRLRADKSIQAFLRELSEKDQNRIAWSATRAGAAVIRDKIKENYKHDDPNTPINISDFVAIQRASRMADDTKTAYRVGIQGGAQKKSKGDVDYPYYWRMIEFGTRHMKAKPFVRPAAEQSVNQVYITISQQVWKGVEAALRKAKRAGK